MVQANSCVSNPGDPGERCAPAGGGDARVERDETAAPEQHSLLGQQYYYLAPADEGAGR